MSALGGGRRRGPLSVSVGPLTFSLLQCQWGWSGTNCAITCLYVFDILYKFWMRCKLGPLKISKSEKVPKAMLLPLSSFRRNVREDRSKWSIVVIATNFGSILTMSAHQRWRTLLQDKSNKKLSWCWQTRATRLKVNQCYQTKYHSISQSAR